MRTRTTSIAKTCPVCGTFNRVVIYSTEIRPSFSIKCSGCRTAIFKPRAPGKDPARVSPLPSTARLEGGPGPAGRPVQPNHLVAADRRRRRDGRSAVPAPCGAPGTGAPCGVRDRAVRLAAGVVAQMTLVTTAAALMLGFALDSTPPSAVSRQIDRTDLAGVARPPALADSARALAFSGAAADTTPHFAQADATPPRAAADMAPRLAAAERPHELPAAPEPQKRIADGDAGRSKVGARPAPPLVPALSGPITYPATRAETIAVATSAPDEAEAAATEAALDLSARTRREVQRRLSLTPHDPVLVDGVFGPTTRTAIASWQMQAGLPATGYLDAGALDALVAETEDAYRAWKIAARKRGSDRARLAALESPIPVASPAGMRDGCRRLRSGEIVYGQNFRCDFRGLQEDLGTLRDEMAQLLRSS